MRIPRFLAALALLAASALSLPASAGQLSQSPALSDGLIVNVGGCHRDVERHYVPEYGRRAWHYHRGSSCRPRRVEGPGFIPGPPRPVDCHRDARRHYLPEYGERVVHRHVGDSCRVRILRRAETFRPGACVTVGPITFCD
ncbi:MAG: hypothetical protein ABIK36_16125 [Pseudomonadota bacterium]